MIAVRRLVEGRVVCEVVFGVHRPIVLGRGEEADFPLLDPSISRVHARLVRDETGALWIEDAGSRNGLVVAGARVERAPVPNDRSLLCRLGAVDIELLAASAEATLEWRLETPPPRAWPGPVLYWLAGVVATVASMVVHPAFWSPWQRERLTGAVGVAMGAAFALPVVAFVLVGLLRIAGRRARVALTLRALAVVLGLFALVAVLELAVPYVSRPGFQWVLVALLRVPMTLFAVAYLASVARRGPRRRFFLAWLGVAALAGVAFYFVGAMNNRQAGSPSVYYEASVPLRGFAFPTSSLDRYLDRVREDFRSAEDEAATERARLEPSGPR